MVSLKDEELIELEIMFRSGDGKQPWTAAIKLGEYIPDHHEEVWPFVKKWGCSKNQDTRMAVATCLLEHVLEYHFETYFSLVKDLALENSHFADTFSSCSKFGQSKEQVNSKLWNSLRRRLGKTVVG